MAVSAAKFIALADKFNNDTFKDLTKTLIMRTANPPVYGEDQTYTTEAGTGIELSLSHSAYQNTNVKVGDFLIFTNASQWLTDPKASNIDLVFNGKVCSIILVDSDAADAAYFITVRANE